MTFFIYPVKEVNNFFCWKVSGFSFDPGSIICHVLSTPLMGATLFFILMSNCEFDWCMDICMKLWMSVVSLWLTGILYEHWYTCVSLVCHSLCLCFFSVLLENVCLLFFLSLLLYPPMHIFTCWSNKYKCSDQSAFSKEFPS